MPERETVKKEIKVAKESVFSVLSKIDVSRYVKKLRKQNKKTGVVTEVSYLPWASCLGLLQTYYPDVDYYVVEYDRHGIEIPRDTRVIISEKLSYTSSVAFNGVMHGYEYRKDGDGLVVTTSMTIEGITRRMTLPVYDFYGGIAKTPDPNLLNKARWRCLVKNAAMFGLGIELYAGEEMPEEVDVASLPQNRIVTKTVMVDAPVEQHPFDPKTHIIETEYPDNKKAKGRRMSVLLENRSDSSLKILDWYSKNGSENDRKAAIALLKTAQKKES